jgi:hypothetical protein
VRWTVRKIGGGFRGLEGRGRTGDEDGQLELSGYKEMETTDDVFV